MNALIAPATPSNDASPTPSSDADRYRTILETKIRQGREQAARVLERIEQDQPRDQIVPASAVRFEPSPAHGIVVEFADDQYTPTDFALGQIAGRAGVPGSYLRELVDVASQPWQSELAAHILRTHHAQGLTGRILARSVRGQLRGWLSDRYRRLDSRPLVDALAREAAEAGAVPIDAVATETRVAIKMVLPRIFEPLDREFVVFGGEWSNSEVGNGVHSFRTFALRVVCLNGMTRENVLKQVHLGTRLHEDLELSERTHRLDTATSVSALRDVVRRTFRLGPELMTRAIRDAHDRSMSTAQLARATHAMPKVTQKAITDAFESSDIINLPAGNTAWRASNAISWIARNTESLDLRIDLERAAGALV